MVCCGIYCNKFTFKIGEGLPIAIREDSTKFTNAHLVKWDATKKSFVDAGETIDGIKTYVNDKITESITTVLNTPV